MAQLTRTKARQAAIAALISALIIGTAVGLAFAAGDGPGDSPTTVAGQINNNIMSIRRPFCDCILKVFICRISIHIIQNNLKLGYFK